MTTKTYQIALGLNDRETKVQKYSTIEAYKIVTNLICARFGGGSVFEGRGVYRHTDGSNAVVSETTLFIFISGAERSAIMAFCAELREMFNQESVMLSERDEITSFI